MPIRIGVLANLGSMGRIQMINYFQLFLSVAILALVSSYMAWCKIRVFFVRQELFNVRDTLWDAARELNGFNDPAYLEARSNMNAMIRSAHKFNLQVLLYMLGNFPHEPKQITSTSSEMQAAINQARKDATGILARYVVIYRPFSALYFMVKLMIALKSKNIMNTVRDKIDFWLNGGGPGHLVSLTCH